MGSQGGGGVGRAGFGKIKGHCGTEAVMLGIAVHHRAVWLLDGKWGGGQAWLGRGEVGGGGSGRPLEGGEKGGPWHPPFPSLA